MVLDLDEWSREPSVPRYLVDSAQFFRASPGLLVENIRIIDYGDSFRVGWPNNLSIDQGSRVSGFSPPENLRGLKATRSSDLWALGYIIFEIRAGSHLFPTAIVASPSSALWEIEDTLGSLPSNLPSHGGDGYPDLSGKSKASDKSAIERIYQLVADIRVESRANYEGAMIETGGQQEARDKYNQLRPHIKSDPNLFWKPEPSMDIIYVDTLNRSRKKTVERGETFTKDLVHGSRAIVSSTKPGSVVSSEGAQISCQLGPASLVCRAWKVGGLM